MTRNLEIWRGIWKYFHLLNRGILILAWLLTPKSIHTVGEEAYRESPWGKENKNRNKLIHTKVWMTTLVITFLYDLGKGKQPLWASIMHLPLPFPKYSYHSPLLVLKEKRYNFVFTARRIYLFHVHNGWILLPETQV